MTEKISQQTTGKSKSRRLRAYVEVANNCFTQEERRDLGRMFSEADGGRVDIEANFESFEVDHYKRPKRSEAPSGEKANPLCPPIDPSEGAFENF